MTDLPDEYVSGQLDKVARSVSTGPGETGVAVALEISQVYATDQADLWNAVTTAERLARWFAPVHGELEVGGSFQVEGNAAGVIQTCEPPSGFTATWGMGEGASLIDVRVEAVDDGHARLRLIHTGDIDASFWELYGPGAVGVGWDLGLLGLALYIATGTGRPAEVDAWGAGDQAKGFMRDSSDRWVAAAIASGTAEADARRAGDQTAAFYLGEQ